MELRDNPELRLSEAAEGVRVLTPLLPVGLEEQRIAAVQRALLDSYLAAHGVHEFVAWYYTPMALAFSDHLAPYVTVYDCMDQLSAFQGAPPGLVDEEQRLFQKADIVFAGGASLYAAKTTQHPNVHLFPSSIDYSHFSAARQNPQDPADQAGIPHPRIGFYGVLDERLDRELLRELAFLSPERHFILIGPVAKINEADLPRASNLHYLGHKAYQELPAYLGNWDVAMLPFARNAATEFISPTKTPEYLAGGKPVISTPIRDVVRPYGEIGLVHIASTAREFASAIERALQAADAEWLARVDALLAENSWDKTFSVMRKMVQQCASTTSAPSQPRGPETRNQPNV
jgi:glycosyltransferase involved in cell wall biosynthesis